MDDKTFTPISAPANETADPVDATEPSSKAPKPTRNSSTSSLPATRKLQPKQSTSGANSPAASREASPNRPGLKSSASGRSTNGPGRSRKNSSQDVSPARSVTSSTNPPSAAATQRALSAASIPTLHPTTSDSTIKTPVPQKPSTNPEIRETPRWPISPRLRVSSIPQVAVGPIGGGGNNGSIRTKPSTETIRPKKEKKKTARKAPSVTSNTGEQQRSSRSKQHHHHSIRENVSETSSIYSPEMEYGQGPFSSYGSFATSPERPSASRKPSLNFPAVSAMLIRSRPASSKADIFEAKVASAVDEANSSDSEETFVYESNPPEVNDRPRRFHSRTPSATSMASQADQRNGLRSILDGHHSVAMKKSMKFANSYNSNAPEANAGDDDGKGTARSNVGTGRGTTHHHHIGGRWSRNNGGNGHPSLFDTESPFPNAAKSKMAGNNPRHSSRPTSPRVANMRMAGNGRKSSPMSSGYDLDDGADDERTPLMNTVRSNRSVRGRRQNISRHHLERQSSPHDKSFLARCAGCLVLTVMIIMVISGALVFIFATTQPLTDVKVMALKNVLASEQDIIFDMQVRARNPNLVVVSVDYADLFIFAKSKYAGTDTEWWRKPNPGEKILRRGLRKRDDDPLDPPVGDDPGSSPNLEIGHIHMLDSPLTFEGSPFRNQTSTSLGQIRIDHPGNHTVPAGSVRWGRVLQHEFELIVRGTLKYSLPLGQKTRSISVEGRVTVEPNAADQDPDDAVHII
ncbi:uncharacterized protein LY89DRAFT_93730 [Mollisia scopiformis]|uniref:Phospholipid metabolism enzyme regulator n=1 Tax=Mollisia scopiformis TaxID=149040 RepID=A0A194X6K5_MOLSC|nr:uncharacterized protein LY89DRAFT_93730 [Mollisia scopiformis]KUJ15714.1 hypothetical protein LY89DRAFT_93730 [Mollisia scopiformis]